MAHPSGNKPSWGSPLSSLCIPHQETLIALGSGSHPVLYLSLMITDGVHLTQELTQIAKGLDGSDLCGAYRLTCTWAVDIKHSH